MVVAEIMNKPVLKISVSDSESESSSAEEIDESENEVEATAADTDEPDAENETMEEDDEADVESVTSEDEDSKEGVLMSNEGWGDSVAKILGSKKPKNKKTLVLSRAKKHSEIVKTEKDEKPAFEVIGETDEKKSDVKFKQEESEPPAKKPKHEKPSLRIKPNILEKDRERLLTKIATKGVVQLFNAVRNQQKTLEKEIDRSDLSEAKKEKILKKFDKRTFLDTLMGQSKSVIVDEEARSLKNELKAEDTPKWGALRDDFMMGAKMKDWDKESVDE